MYYATITPAYGRDYKSLKALKDDLAADRDFLLDGRPINRPQLIEMGLTQVNVRYKRLTAINVVKLS